LVTRQPIREVADGVLSLRPQSPLRVHVEGEEEDAAGLTLLLVVRSLNRVGLVDDLVNILAPVGGTAGAGDEDINCKCFPVVESCDIPRPVVGEKLALSLETMPVTLPPEATATRNSLKLYLRYV